jgi:hypothetical protein
MRLLTLASVLSVVFVAPAFAQGEQKHTGATPSFSDCFRLGWVRGMHVEQGELPDWNEQCMAGQIPFDSGYAVTTIRPDHK